MTQLRPRRPYNLDDTHGQQLDALLFFSRRLRMRGFTVDVGCEFDVAIERIREAIVSLKLADEPCPASRPRGENWARVFAVKLGQPLEREA